MQKTPYKTQKLRQIIAVKCVAFGCRLGAFECLLQSEAYRAENALNLFQVEFMQHIEWKCPGVRAAR